MSEDHIIRLVHEEYPNIEACAENRTSGRLNEWPVLRVECDNALHELAELRYLLHRIWGWDHMDSAADGAYWRSEIERVVTGIG